jgi:hypothetical protein
MKVIQTRPGVMMIRCRACRQHHIPVPRWTFNGDMENPTFSPSVNETCNSPDHPHYQAQAQTSRCHFTVTNGQITYHGDCTHPLAGQTFPLEHWEQSTVDFYAKSGGDG